MKLLSKIMMTGLMLMTASFVNAQQHYIFNCKDYVSTDDARAPQSAFSYDTNANTFSISASGANNVAFKMNEGMDGEYFIDNDETMLMICGENLSKGNTSSYVWWLNGYNNGQNAADNVYTDGSNTVIIWNLKTNNAINRNFDFSKDKIYIGANGNSFILAIGLTAQNSTKPGVINDFGYYAPFEVAAKHPSLMSQMGFTARTLTSAIKTKILKLDSTQSEATAAISATDYSSAYSLYLKVRETKEEETGTHVGSYSSISNGILAKLDDQSVRVIFHNDSTVRVSKAYDLNSIKQSWAVISEPADNVDFTVTENNGVVTLQGNKLKVEYLLNKGSVTIYDAEGNQLIGEVNHRFMATKDGPFDSYTITQYFKLADDERIYGMGQLQDGNLNRRGTVVRLEQENRSICIPYFLSSKNYGLYWDNYSPTTFNDTGSTTMFRSTGTAIDYYVLAASNSHEVQRSLRKLTGDCQMPPLWNFGVYQSKERYVSGNEVMSVVRKYRNLKIPFDCLVQDWQYWGDNAHWNAMEFLNPDYANYQQMIDFIHDNNAKIMISIWASFGPQTKQFAELRDKDLLFTCDTWPPGEGVKPYNPYSPVARDIYWKYLWNGIMSKGVDAYWMDSTEPDFFGNEGDKDKVALPGQTWRSLRNAFPLATVSGVAEHHLAQPELSGKRVSIMTRSGYVGMQRTGAYIWSADITSSWETLLNQIIAACNVTESGLPYWNSDTGGFFTGSYGGVGDAAWRRLYVRWTQFSTFTPMLRFHGTGTPREPWQFGTAGDARGEYDNIVRYIKLRYSLLPYIYSTAHQVRTDAQGFMQAMPLAFPNDNQAFDVKDQYLFGKSFLVAPVVQDGVNGRNVYLPNNDGGWLDFWTGYTFDGGQSVFKVAPMDIMPLYLKAGTIMPWGPEVQYSTEKPWDNLEIRLYPGADGSFTLYEDEFDNNNYKDGKFTEIPITWNEATKTLTFGKRVGSYNGMIAERKFNVVVVTPEKGFGDKLSKTYDAVVDYNGEEVSVVLETKNVAEPVVEEIEGVIVNPSFEADGRALTKVAPQGWTVKSSTAWWGVNQVSAGATGDPQPTDGQFLFGVWDGSVMSASIYQTINSLPSGDYRLSVDMHASNRDNAVRVGKQCVYANEAMGLFSEQVSAAGIGDAYPMQTISVDFSVANDNDPVEIGVRTGNAPAETWFKIDNFRLYKVTQGEATAITLPSENIALNSSDAYYTLSGLRVVNPSRGIYIHNGKKIIIN